jgi:hypothetical protein
VVPGKRTPENAKILIEKIHQRTGGETNILITSDNYKPYITAIKEVYGVETSYPKSGNRGRPKEPKIIIPPELCYGVVHKERRKNHVIKVERRIIFGNQELLLKKLQDSSVSSTINTSFIERENGTDRLKNSRKRRATYCFSKNKTIHESVGYFTAYFYNFCWNVRTLNIKTETNGIIKRSPAMAAGLADHIWTVREWCLHPVVGMVS